MFLFKHSSSCPVSAYVWQVFQNFARQESEAEFWRVLVIEQRALSRQIARHTGIAHESPQVILFHKEKPVWNESHLGISRRSLKGALKSINQELV